MRSVITKQTAARVLAAAVVVGLGLVAAFAGSTTPTVPAAAFQRLSPVGAAQGSAAAPASTGREIKHGVRVAPAEFNGSVRKLPQIAPKRLVRPVRDEGGAESPGGEKQPLAGAEEPSHVSATAASAPAPSPNVTFKGLDYLTWGAGHPPDTVGDVGPDHFVQAVNTSIGIFSKSGGAPLAAFTFDAFFTGTGTVCDADNQGDPTVVYDPQADRWIVADFAFTGDGSTPPFFECIAVSKTADPVSGGWWFYAIRTDDASHPWFADYPKMGIWPDGLYMTANMFSDSFEEVRVWAFNRSDLEAGLPVRNVVVDVGNVDPVLRFSLLPSNMRTVTGVPPAGRPNLLVSESLSDYAFEVWKFHVDYSGSGSTFTGPTNVSQASYNFFDAAVPTPGNSLDALFDRLMTQAQYTNIAGVESLWVNHTVRCCGAGSPMGIQWAQLNVTGGAVPATPIQQQIYPSASDTLHRWMGSLAVDKKGDMALGYSVANGTTNPDIRYAGRLVGDALNTLPQTETTMLSGVTRGTQSGKCGTSKCTRWGDYSAMTIDPDGCRFWYTQEYYETTGLNWQTRIGSFSFPSCGTSKIDQTITFGGPTAKTYGDPDFTVTATASSGLPVSFSAGGNCTVAGSLVHITGAGSCTITASQAGDATYNPAPDVVRTFPIAKANQTISFGALAAKTYGDPDFAISATASSGLTISFGALGNCTVSGSTVHITGAGSCTVTASQAGNSNYNAATSVSQTFSIAKANQTITFGALADKTYGDPDFTVTATASSGLAVAFTTDGNCTVTGATVHLTGAGSCTVNAGQPGDANFNAAPAVLRTFSIAKAGQTIAFPAIADKVLGAADFDPGATASSGLAVSYVAAGPCSIVGTKVHLTGTGSCTVTASQAGNANYAAAPDVLRSFSIKSTQTITFAALPAKTYGDADFAVGATASSGLTVSFAAGGNCTISVATVHITGAGSCTVTASQAGDANYLAAPDVARTFAIAKAAQTITFPAIADKVLGAADFDPGATASSGLAVSYAAAGPCSIVGTKVHLTGTGSCTVTASQAGDANYAAAVDVAHSFSIKSTQTITFGALAAKTYGDPDFAVSATASSGLAVSFAAAGDCTVSAATVHITGAGSCTVTASQAGDSGYLAAPDVARSFTIAKAAQTITFPAIADKALGDADFDPGATASSGLVVSYAAAGPCSIVGTEVHLTGAGSCTVTASQPGNANYSAAADVARSFSIKSGQTITFGALPAKTYGDPDFLVSASATSGLTVSFAAAGACTVSAATVHLTGAGSCTVTASQAGDATYLAAPDVVRSFAIAKASQSIAFGTLASRTYGDADFDVSATASSGLPVSFGAGGDCTVAGTTVHLSGAGSCTLTASQPGNANYDAAAPVAQTFAIAKASQSVSFGALAGRTFGDPDFTVGATASSRLPVTFFALGTCTVAGATVGITGAGSCTVTASQSGDANYSAAAPVSQTFAIAKAAQTITFAAIPDKTFGEPDFGVSATASSGLVVSFGASGSCTVAGAIVHLTGTGTCTITASQAGDANFASAPDVSHSFTVKAQVLKPAATCRVPKVVGKRLAAARLALKQRHCRTGKVGYAYSRKLKRGLVTSQSRRAGRVLRANSKINLVVSRGLRR